MIRLKTKSLIHQTKNKTKEKAILSKKQKQKPTTKINTHSYIFTQIILSLKSYHLS